jgi:hypothetical protein
MTKTSARPTEGPRGGKTTVTKSGLIRAVVYLHPDEREALRRTAFEEDRPASEIMREALRRHLRLEEQNPSSEETS